MAVQAPPDPPQTATRSTPEPRSESRELPLDVRFDLLSNQRRRFVLRYLASESDSTTLGALAERIASIENDKPEAALSSTERKRVYICLYQSHLPKMADAGVIDFDEDRKTVEIGENFGQVTGYLPQRPDADPVEGDDESESWFPDLVRAVERRIEGLTPS